MKKLLKKPYVLLTVLSLLSVFCFTSTSKAIVIASSNANLNNIFLSPTKNHKQCIDNAFNKYKSTKKSTNTTLKERMDYIFKKCKSTKKRDVYFSASYCYLAVAGQEENNNLNSICAIPLNNFNAVANNKYKDLFNQFKQLHD